MIILEGDNFYGDFAEYLRPLTLGFSSAEIDNPSLMTVTCGSIPILVAVFVLLFLLRYTLYDPFIRMPPKPKLNVHSFPRPPLLEKTPRHLQVKWRGQTIADTNDAYWVLETTHPPSKYPRLI